MISILVVLVIAGLALWAITQFPIDGTILKLIRVVIVVFAVLFILWTLGLIPSDGFHRRWR